MREIKFRVWDGKRMVYDDSIVVGCSGKLYGVDSYDTPKPSHDDWWTALYAVRDDLVCMRYTGFEDTNEQEIYEGDIVQWEDETYVVEEYTELSGAWYPFADTEEGEPCILTRTPSWFEVIGNIFENDYSEANRCKHNRPDLVAIILGANPPSQ